MHGILEVASSSVCVAAGGGGRLLGNATNLWDLWGLPDKLQIMGQIQLLPIHAVSIYIFKWLKNKNISCI